MGWGDSVAGVGLGTGSSSSKKQKKKPSQQKIIGNWGNWGQLAHRAQVINSKRFSFLFYSNVSFLCFYCVLYCFCFHFSLTTDKQVNPVAPLK